MSISRQYLVCFTAGTSTVLDPAGIEIGALNVGAAAAACIKSADSRIDIMNSYVPGIVAQ